MEWNAKTIIVLGVALLWGLLLVWWVNRAIRASHQAGIESVCTSSTGPEAHVFGEMLATSRPPNSWLNPTGVVLTSTQPPDSTSSAPSPEQKNHSNGSGAPASECQTGTDKQRSIGEESDEDALEEGHSVPLLQVQILGLSASVHVRFHRRKGQTRVGGSKAQSRCL